MTTGSGGDPVGVPTACFGEVVRRRRRELDLTQAALARRVGCSAAMVKKAEHDQRRPSVTMATRLAEALEVSDGQCEASWRRPRAGCPLVASQHGPWGPVVGREPELATLGQHLDAACCEGARLVFVTGESSQGKSSGLAAFWHHLRVQPPVLHDG